MSSIAISQLAVPGVNPSDVQVFRVWPRTGRINLSILNEGERKNDGTMKTGSTLNFALLESESGDADGWTLISKSGTSKTATASASDANGVAITVSSQTTITEGDYVAVTGSDIPKLNGVFRVYSGSGVSPTTIVLDTPWVAASHSGLTTASVTEVSPITVVAGGQEVADVMTQKKLLKVAGWGTTSGGYARMDLQLNGNIGWGQVDIEVVSNKQGYGFDGNGAAGVGGMGRSTVWPEVP